MAVLPILEYPDPRLRLCAAPVADFDADLARLVADLGDTLRASGGIGLSAPQVGDRRRVLVMDLSGGVEPPEVYINPELLERAAPGLVEESCLSVPGVAGNVVRATQLVVRARDHAGAAFERRVEGMRAVCLQHEVDHLDGRLLTDRLSIFRRLRLRLGAAARARAVAG